MKIAVVGAGFCGMAVTYYLLQQGHYVTVYDAKPIGESTSGIAAGLMHPYAGRFANYNWKGKEGLAATSQLLNVASTIVGIPVADFSGLLRLALESDQLISFGKSARKHPDLLWQTSDEARARVPGIAQAPGIFIPSAVTVNCPLYLKGLWQACEKLGGVFEKKTVHDLNEFDSDRIVLTTGAHKGLHDVPLTQVKGQILEYDYSRILPISINSKAYIVTQFGSCLAGATFEKQFSSLEPDIEVAKLELEPKIHALFPELTKHSIIACRSGVRASTHNHLPIIKQINEKTWVLTGMGSKGLLYHALFAQELCERISL
jgi:glycine/D-amino acid oxidase-like deaminating enzyme